MPKIVKNLKEKITTAAKRVKNKIEETASETVEMTKKIAKKVVKDPRKRKIIKKGAKKTGRVIMSGLFFLPFVMLTWDFIKT